MLTSRAQGGQLTILCASSARSRGFTKAFRFWRNPPFPTLSRCSFDLTFLEGSAPCQSLCNEVTDCFPSELDKEVDRNTTVAFAHPLYFEEDPRALGRHRFQTQHAYLISLHVSVRERGVKNDPDAFQYIHAPTVTSHASVSLIKKILACLIRNAVLDIPLPSSK